MMKKTVKVWLIGGLVAVSVMGAGLAMAAGKSADSGKQGMMQSGQMVGNIDPKAMADMMKTPEMQKECVDMMKSPEMQQAMIGVMKQPEMQAAMKQMLQQDPAFHQMMLDLVNSIDMNMDHGNMTPNTQPSSKPSEAPQTEFDHNAHHQ